MSSQITTAFVNQFSANVTMLSQQMGSLLRNTVDVETINGEKPSSIKSDRLLPSSVLREILTHL